DRVAVVDVDAAAQPILLRPGYRVAGDPVVAHHGVAVDVDAAAGHVREVECGLVLPHPAGDLAAVDREIGDVAPAVPGGEDDGATVLRRGVDDGRRLVLALHVLAREDEDPLRVGPGGHLDGRVAHRAGVDAAVGVVQGRLDGRVGRRGGAASREAAGVACYGMEVVADGADAGTGAAGLDVEGHRAGGDHEAGHEDQEGDRSGRE